MTQLTAARQGKLTPQMEYVLADEPISAMALQTGIAEGSIVIPANRNHQHLTPYGIGRGLRVKVNANIGTSSDLQSLDSELEKLQVAIDSGAHAVMDLSTGGEINHVRREILSRCPVPLGTVPIYQAVTEGVKKRGFLGKVTVDDFFSAVENPGSSAAKRPDYGCGQSRWCFFNRMDDL